jgi:hypothetical protein
VSKRDINHSSDTKIKKKLSSASSLILVPSWVTTDQKRKKAAVLRIRNGRIHLFLGLPDPDPLVRDMDPDRLRILLSSRRNGEKNIDSYCFVTSF